MPKDMAIIFILCVLLALVAGEIDRSSQCVNIKKCRCLTNADRPGYFKMACREVTTEELANLDMPTNTTNLVIHHAVRLNATVLQRLTSNIETIANITIRFSNITEGHFSFAWLPDSTTKLHLFQTNIVDLYATTTIDENGTAEYRCNMSHLKEFRRLSLSYASNLKVVPACMPSTITTLVLRSIDLSHLGKITNGVATKWPDSLTHLQLTDNNITHLSDKVFSTLLPKLTWMTMKNQPITDGNILLRLPARTLEYLMLQNTSIDGANEDHFKNFRRYNLLESFGITFSKLKKFPAGMPASVVDLYLSNNKIKYLDYSELSRLKTLKSLDMRRNLLTNIPADLPDTLQQIHFDHNQIVFCDRDAFSRINDLKRLTFANNSLKIMPTNIPYSIEYYSLEGNAISDIGPTSNYDFCGNCVLFDIENNPWACNINMMEFLVWTSKYRNRTFISKISKTVKCEKDLLPGLNHMLLENIMRYIQEYKKIGCSFDVKTLNCTENGMENLPKLSKAIKNIHIKNNPAIGKIQDFVFASLKALTILTLENIGLTRIPRGLPRTIEHFSLAYNNLTEITDADAEALKNLTSVKTIDLSYNKLKSIPLMCMKPLVKLTMVILKGNPLVCNCEIWPYATWAHQKSEFSLEDGLRGECAYPLSKKGSYVTKILDYLKNKFQCVPVQCEWDETTPVINCSYATQKNKSAGQQIDTQKIPPIPRNGYWRMIDLSGLQLKIGDVKLTHLYNLRDVKLSHNSLSAIPIEGLPSTVVNLFLDWNNINSLPKAEELRIHFKNLQCLDVRNNNIRNLSKIDVSLFRRLSEMKLHGNPLVCDCDLKTVSAWMSANGENQLMKKHALQNLKCREPRRLRQKFIANLTEAEYCPMNVGVIIGGLTGGIAFLVVVFIVGLCYWQRQSELREREDILHGFQELLQQEAEFPDADPETGMIESGKFRYDAFLSYSPHDEDAEFASKILDNLEISHGYNLCVHERDFIPGVGIADNIVESIGASKRIILLISHNFIESPWCQYEVQVALTELHQKRKSKLLIPILLEDLDGRVEGSLKTFLSLIKSIKIPKNRSQSRWEAFWNEVLEAMPEPPVVDKNA